MKQRLIVSTIGTVLLLGLTLSGILGNILGLLGVEPDTIQLADAVVGLATLVVVGFGALERSI